MMVAVRIDIVVKHKGTIINQRRIYDYPALIKSQIQQLEGRRFVEVIEEEPETKTIPQLAFYHGGIIAGTCMKATLFEGWIEGEIDFFFRRTFLSYEKTFYDGQVSKTISVVQRLSGVSKEQMVLFLDNVIEWLAQRGIKVLNPDQYKYGKYLTWQDLPKYEDDW